MSLQTSIEPSIVDGAIDVVSACFWSERSFPPAEWNALPAGQPSGREDPDAAAQSGCRSSHERSLVHEHGMTSPAFSPR